MALDALETSFYQAGHSFDHAIMLAGRERDGLPPLRGTNPASLDAYDWLCSAKSRATHAFRCYRVRSKKLPAPMVYLLRAEFYAANASRRAARRLYDSIPSVLPAPMREAA